jgi:hypothetical protein
MELKELATDPHEFFNRETYADLRRLFNRATRAIKRYVIPLARDKKLTYTATT